MSDDPANLTPLPDASQNAVSIPAVELAGVNVAVGPHPVNPELKALTIGPVFLVLPLDTASARQVATALTGIEIVPAGRPLIPERHRRLV